MTQTERKIRGLGGTETSMPVDCIVLAYDFTDADLSVLHEKPKLLLLDLTESKITDAGLEFIPTIPRLERLYLTSVIRVTDTGLKFVAKSQSLKELCLLDTSVSDEGLRHLKELKSLEKLRIGSWYMSGAGLAHLIGMESLSYLSLSVEFNEVNQKRVSDLKAANPALLVNW